MRSALKPGNSCRIRTICAALLCGLLVAGCGDESAEEEGTASASRPNSSPTISGSPANEVAVGAIYSFRPSASDPDGDRLTFSIANKPGWASFNSGTGAMTGSPADGDVGEYADIRISVSDGAATAELAAFAVTVVGAGQGAATVSWTAPATNTDGSALTDLTGYRVYWGQAEGNYTRWVSVDVGLTTHMVEGLTRGTWYFAATAVNSLGIESTFSNVASKTIDY